MKNLVNSESVNSNNVAKVENNAASQQQADSQVSKTYRVFETREDWDRLFSHTTQLIVNNLLGKTTEEDPRNGFDFKSVKLQPHSRAYVQSLLAAFCSQKAAKKLASVDGLDLSAEGRTKVALQILLSTKLGGATEDKAKAILAKAKPKQAAALSLAVINRLQQEKNSTAEPVAKPSKVEKSQPKKKGNKKSSK